MAPTPSSFSAAAFHAASLQNCSVAAAGFTVGLLNSVMDCCAGPLNCPVMYCCAVGPQAGPLNCFVSVAGLRFGHLNCVDFCAVNFQADPLNCCWTLVPSLLFLLFLDTWCSCFVLLFTFGEDFYPFWFSTAFTSSLGSHFMRCTGCFAY